MVELSVLSYVMVGQCSPVLLFKLLALRQWPSHCSIESPVVKLSCGRRSKHNTTISNKVRYIGLYTDGGLGVKYERTALERMSRILSFWFPVSVPQGSETIRRNNRAG